MKIRSGFVSNSSSSSFIIGIGVVKDEKALNEKLEGAFAGKEVQVKSLVEILSSMGDRDNRWSYYGPSLYDDTLVIESFRGDTVSLDISDVAPDAKIAFVDTTGELDDDFAFYVDEDGYNLDYDLSPTEADNTLISVFYSDAIEKGDASGGAARNG